MNEAYPEDVRLALATLCAAVESRDPAVEALILKGR